MDRSIRQEQQRSVIFEPFLLQIRQVSGLQRLKDSHYLGVKVNSKAVISVVFSQTPVYESLFNQL